MNDTATVTQIYQGDAALRDLIRNLLASERRLSQAVLAKEAGVSTTTLNQWLNGKYLGDNEGVEIKLRIWIDADTQRRDSSGQMPEAPSFVPTPTAQRILGALSYAKIAGDIAVIYGGAGLGKSSACVQFRDQMPNVWIATMSPSTAGVVPSLEEICESLALAPGGGALRMSRAIKKRIRETRGLLIIDEAQHLSVAALDEIRSIHDATEIGIALVGNDGVFARMAGGRNAQQLDRLYSRVGKKLRLTASSDQDVAEIIKAWGVEDIKCRTALVSVAREGGHLRRLTKTLRLASMHAAADGGRAVCCEDVRAAISELMEGAR